MLGSYFPLLLLWVIQQGNAQNVPNPSNNTINNSTQLYEPGWVAGPRTRGTLGLVFSCLVTLFLCVWTTIHVNIEPDGKYNPTLAKIIPIRAIRENKWLLKFLAKRSIRKLGWGFVTLFIPEGVMAIAAYERRTAYLLRDAINSIINKRKSLAAASEPEIILWDMNLAYYAIMGGFVIPETDYDAVSDEIGKTCKNGEEIKTRSEPHPPSHSEEEKVVTSSSLPREDKAFKIITSDLEKQVGGIKAADATLNKVLFPLHLNKPLTLTPYGVYMLAQWQWGTNPANIAHVEGKKLNLFPITSTQVSDKNNANSLAKSLVAWQALWMIVQVISRATDHPKLPVTLLELHTSLHTFCAFAVYLAWWSKPVDIETPTTVYLSREQIIFLRNGISSSNSYDPTNPFNPATGEKNVIPLPDSGSYNTDVFLTSRMGIGKLLYRHLCGQKNLWTEYFAAISDAYIRLWKGRKQVWKEGLIISFVGLVFGGVHLAAWDSSFPTNIERILWQIAAAITAIAWSVFVLSLWASVLVETRRDRLLFSRACGAFLGVGIFPVLLVRLYLLVESFASIRRLPLGSYQLTIWSNVWPHAG